MASFCANCRSVLYPGPNGPHCRKCDPAGYPKRGWGRRPVNPDQTALGTVVGASGPPARSRSRQSEGPGRAATRWRKPTNGGSGASSLSAAAGGLAYFPHDGLRDGQRGLARDAARAAASGRILVANAPTGLGKTAAALAPFLEEAERQGKLVVVLTSKQSQHHVFVETLREAAAKRGFRGSVVDVISKADMCPRPEKGEMSGGAFLDWCSRLTSAGKCEYFRNPTSEARAELLRTVSHVEELVDVSLTHGCCPHKVAMEALGEAGVLVCDYNYLFSDMWEQTLANLGRDLSDLLLIVDEAHNLPERVRSNYSTALSPYLLGEASREARKGGEAGLARSLNRLSDALGNLLPAGEKERVMGTEELDGLILGSIEDLEKASVEEFEKAVARALGRLARGEDSPEGLEQLAEFLHSWRHRGDGYARYVSQVEGGAVRVHLMLMDPGLEAARVWQGVAAAIVMSGTLHPPQFYADLLGVPGERALVRSYASPFPVENRPAFHTPELTTLYGERTDDSLAAFGRLAERLRGKVGNVALFMPSYDLAERAARGAPASRLLLERREMTKGEKRELVEALVQRREDGAILIGVAGGPLSEGVDYAGNLLRAVVVGGIPLAPPSLEVNLLIDHYERKFPGRGKEYGYFRPAISKVLQCLGRGIRSETDHCIQVLADRRYGEPFYKRLLPPDLRTRPLTNLG